MISNQISVWTPTKYRVFGAANPTHNMLTDLASFKPFPLHLCVLWATTKLVEKCDSFVEGSRHMTSTCWGHTYHRLNNSPEPFTFKFELF